MLLIRRIEIENFACFDRIDIEPSTNPGEAPDSYPCRERFGEDDAPSRDPLGNVRREGTAGKRDPLLASSGFTGARMIHRGSHQGLDPLRNGRGQPRPPRRKPDRIPRTSSGAR